MAAADPSRRCSSSTSSSRRRAGLLLLSVLLGACCTCCWAAPATADTLLQGPQAATTAAVRRQREREQQMAGLAARLDVLESEAAAAAAEATATPKEAAIKAAQSATSAVAVPAAPGEAAAAATAGAPDAEETSEGCAGPACPYDLDTIPDLPTLLWRHQQYQTAVLLGAGSVSGSGSSSSSNSSRPRAQVVLVNSNDLVGLGNRVPAVVTGFVLALFTRRLFMLQSTFQQHVELPFPGNWRVHQASIQGATGCNIPWSRLADPSLALCEDLYADRTNGSRAADIWRFTSPDYDVPLLQINPTLEPLFSKFFPDGEVFHPLVRHLLRPRPRLDAALAPYLNRAGRCLVGLHIRTRKYGGVRVKQFTAIARMLARGQEGGVFVASDAMLFPHVQRGLPGRHVWWSEATASALASATRTKAANPGSELSAMVDMFLLARCKHIVLTPASSMGAVAAGYGGVRPVYANFGKHSDPFLNPWFWASPSTEPCFFKASSMHVATDELSSAFRDRHPLYLYHNQCHYQQHLRQMPRYLKLTTNDTSYIQSLLN